VVATSSAAAAGHLQSGLVNVRLGSVLELATSLGALTGALIAARAPSRLLMLLFAAVLVYAAVGMVHRRDREGRTAPASPDPFATRWGLHSAYYDPQEQRAIPYVVANLPGGMAAMWAAGLVSGLLGIGSGLLKVIGMDTAMHLPIKVSTATSNLMIGVTAAGSAGYYLAHGLVPAGLAIPAALGVLIGARLGSLCLPWLPTTVLRWIFVPVLLSVAAEMLWQGLQGWL
ncbi:MAG TPA: sulfite exporter TauE/SafE family protein, partial [Limnochordia bacterium]